MADTPNIQELILKKLKGADLSELENNTLQDWLSLSETNREIFMQLNDPDRLREDMQEFHEAKLNIWEKVDTQLPETKLIPVTVTFPRRRRWLYAAAACALLISLGLFYWQLVHRQRNTSEVASDKNDIVAPIGNKTTLTLGDGTQITVDSLTAGNLAMQGKTHIDKTSSGQIIYSAPPGEAQAKVLFNILSTGYGGFSKVVLPDGSKVWLNSLSSLRFPNVFTSKNREVQLEGEAYFEIAGDKNIPFHVEINGFSLDVLGTHFDIKAYANESILKTTLLEGSVKINTAKASVLLAPGQQAEIMPGDARSQDAGSQGSIHVLQDVDTDEAIAWVNGNFEFNEENVDGVMRQLERWYDIEVKYETRSAIHISGSVSKKKNLSEVLKLLKRSGVDCSIDGRILVVH